MQLLVLPDMNIYMLIGADGLNKHKAKIMYEDRKICLEKQEIDFD